MKWKEFREWRHHSGHLRKGKIDNIWGTEEKGLWRRRTLGDDEVGTVRWEESVEWGTLIIYPASAFFLGMQDLIFHTVCFEITQT